ncbi:hypothetical protein DY000_02060450 [Brassica cretica]|uniref:Uncharacterized protein n=1 Tax=Brassica cretica TaxID=69181 RepID=A0ABQ7AZM1_BRACR|nr:hypothetical protein DY000_02060450 [Brassica cretica]
MSSRSKAWLVAATIGAVEASKDQLGLCRWNYMIRSVNQRIRNNVRSAAQANRFSSSSTILLASCKDCDKSLGKASPDSKEQQSNYSGRKIFSKIQKTKTVYICGSYLFIDEEHVDVHELLSFKAPPRPEQSHLHRLCTTASEKYLGF